jgi:hypothetical protein
MRLANMLMILFIIQATIILYDNVFTGTGSSAYTLTSYDSNQTSIWNFMTDPTAWSDDIFLAAVLALGTGAVAFIAIGTFLNTPSDTSIFAPIMIILIGAGAVPILSLYNVFTRNIAMFGCTALPCFWATFFWLITGGILALFYILAVLEWWSGRSTG